MDGDEVSVRVGQRSGCAFSLKWNAEDLARVRVLGF